MQTFEGLFTRQQNFNLLWQKIFGLIYLIWSNKNWPRSYPCHNLCVINYLCPLSTSVSKLLDTSFAVKMTTFVTRTCHCFRVTVPSKSNSIRMLSWYYFGGDLNALFPDLQKQIFTRVKNSRWVRQTINFSWSARKVEREKTRPGLVLGLRPPWPRGVGGTG